MYIIDSGFEQHKASPITVSISDLFNLIEIESAPNLSRSEQLLHQRAFSFHPGLDH